MKLSAVAVALPIVSKVSAAVPPAKIAAGTEGLTAYDLGPQIWVRWENRPLTCYRAHGSQKYPYMYPVCGPVTGMPLTDETTLPYPHHRSLFFGCDKVNGGNYWQEGFETGQIVSKGPKVGRATPNSVQITDECEWKKPGGPLVMRDRRLITVSVPNKNLRFIDWELDWEAVEKVTIPKTNHSLFSIRAALDITPVAGGNLVNAEGASGEKQTAGVKSAWCAFFGKRQAAAGSPMEGICIMDHPKNPWAPTEWFTRDYGFASPTPLYFNEKPFELDPGKSVKLRYRVVLFGGTPNQAGLADVFKKWAV